MRLIKSINLRVYPPPPPEFDGEDIWSNESAVCWSGESADSTELVIV